MVRYCFNPYKQEFPDWSDDTFAFLKNNDMLAFHESIEGYAPTPLQDLSQLATSLGLKNIYVKDEGHRFGLKAFKALGASYAIYRFLQNKWQEKFDDRFDFHRFSDPNTLAQLGTFTFCAATDGNHGRAVAWTAKKLKQKAVIFMPGDTVPARIHNIRSEGAEVIVIDGSYDDCVTVASQESRKHGWYEVADTAYEGYTTIPAWVLNGYSTLFREMETSLHLETQPKADFVFLQAGVGAFAASGAAYYTKKYQNRRPKLIGVEPLEAAGFLDSIEYGQGESLPAKGRMETIMAGLNCGVPSLVAWPILKDSIDLFLAITDDYAKMAMNAFAEAGIVSGESGAAGLAGLLALFKDPSFSEARQQIGLNENSRVLLINTESDTDPDNYQKIVGNHS